MSYKKAELLNAKWVSADDDCQSPFIFEKLNIIVGEQATITIGCFGMFELYANGKKVGDDLYVPLSTDFHERKGLIYGNLPFEEKLSHRLYCPVYDLTPYLSEGENVLCFHLGTGWYELPYDINYGKAKICWNIKITDGNGNIRNVLSDGNEKYSDSFVKKSNLIFGETHDYRNFNEKTILGGCNELEAVVETESPETNFYVQDCPSDKIIRYISPKKISGNIYDAGEIISGYPIVKAKSGSVVKIRYGELLTSENKLDEEHIYDQYSEYILGNENRLVYPKFTWYCFRYFEIIGDAEVETVAVVHSDVECTSSFESDNEILNWLYNAYIRTQLNNMHCGIPSDCPHTERRGYTGDGQLTCGAAMLLLDALKFYKKWIYDISDCQDRESGHIQYTAPFTQSGGGPGGWGCAIVKVPYEYYKASGDSEILKELYPQMLKWFEFMEAHSEKELVTSDRENVWCLGDWCVAAQKTWNMHDAMLITPPFVNTYFYIKSMETVLQIGKIIDVHENDEILKNRIDIKKIAFKEAFFDENTGDFLGNVQGSNAFAIDLGLGDERTLDNLVEKYKTDKKYDTGIFGTDVLTRVLFENRQSELAFSLLTSKEDISYYSQMKNGATTLMEYWIGERSHCHPMFGAVTRYLFEYILGIRQKEKSSAYDDIIINPQCMDFVKKAKGSIMTSKGQISVEYDEKNIEINIPDNTNAIFEFSETEISLKNGKNVFYIGDFKK